MDENEERSIDKLLDLPYSELTGDEIERVIEFKASVKARDEAYNAQMQLIKDHFEAEIELHRQNAANAQALLDRLTAFAVERFKEVSNGQ